MVVEADGAGAPLVWAHEFSFVRGEGGCVGLQSAEDGAGGGSGRFALFSVRRVGNGQGGDASGCRIAYRWEAGRPYRLRVWTEQEGSWSASVRQEGGDEHLIGRLRVPGDWRRLGSESTMWTKYQGGELSRCRDLPPARAWFSTPTADDGTVEPVRHENRVGDGTCEGSRIEPAPGGVRHLLGEAG